MGGITLQGRQSLSRRVQSFGGLNGRGTNAGFRRFGDMSSDRATVETELSAMATGATGPRNHTWLVNTIDWAALYASDPSWARSAYNTINQASYDPDWQPTIEVWLQKHGVVAPGNTPVTPPVSNPPVTPPVVAPPVSNPLVTTPGMTQAEYEAALAAAQVEAAKLAALASAKQAQNAAESKRIAAEDELARRNAEIASQTAIADAPVAHKSNPIPWLVAAGVAFLVLKG